jgi:curved DNA-binding protein CbpA
MRDPYKDLGVDKDADPKEIKAAYRKKVQDVHPDKKGGDREEFEKVQNAYMVLRDPEKRDHYDKTGKEKKEDKEIHLGIIASLFEQLLNKDDLPYNFNYVQTVKDSLQAMLEETEDKLKSMAKSIAKLEKLKNKFHRKNKKVKPVNDKGPSNFFKQAIEFKIDALSTAMQKGEDLKVNVTRAMEVIDDYEFEVDTGPPPNYSGNDAAAAFRYMFSNMPIRKGPIKFEGS